MEDENILGSSEQLANDGKTSSGAASYNIDFLTWEAYLA